MLIAILRSVMEVASSSLPISKAFSTVFAMGGQGQLCASSLGCPYIYRVFSNMNCTVPMHHAMMCMLEAHKCHSWGHTWLCEVPSWQLSLLDKLMQVSRTESSVRPARWRLSITHKRHSVKHISL